MSARTAGRNGRPWRALRAKILAESDLCWWCGHGGARAIDHLIPIARGGAPTHRDNLAPIHGVERCPACRRNCNSERGTSMRPPPTIASRDW